MNVCIECKHFKKNAFDETKFHECKHPECRHPVSGRPQTCIDMRKRNAYCGPAGDKFEGVSK